MSAAARKAVFPFLIGLLARCREWFARFAAVVWGNDRVPRRKNYFPPRNAIISAAEIFFCAAERDHFRRGRITRRHA